MRPASLLSVVIIGARLSAPAQELVPNPGFETVSSCPTFASMLDSAPPWNNPTGGTPELYHACAGSPAYAGVPCNISGGFQYARTGQAYAGLFTFRSGSPGMREYISTPLLAPMVAGRAYRFRMYVNQPNDVELATDGIGAHFSAGPLTQPGSGVLPYPPHIEHPPGVIITDTLGWTLVAGCYTASGGEDHLTIGNFRNDAGTAHLSVFPGAWYAGAGYFLIDDVSVIPIEAPDLGPDTAVCAGTELLLAAGMEDATFVWQDGSTASTFMASGPGTYWVQAQVGTCTLSDTIHITTSGGSLPELGDDRDLCPGERFTLVVDVPDGGTVLWQDGSSGTTMEVDAPGTYWVRVDGACGEHVDTLLVRPAECTDLVFLPNAFTPNGDDINDVFAPVFDRRTVALRYAVFDRWGAVVFTAEDGSPWAADGTPDGLYAVRWESRLRNGSSDRQSGLTHVTVLR